MKEIKVRKEENYVVVETEDVKAVLYDMRHLLLMADEEYNYSIEGFAYADVDDALDHVEGEYDDDEELMYMDIAKYLWRIGIAAMY